MKSKIFFGLLFFSFLAPLISFADAPKVIFEENKNQWPEQVKFKTDIPGGGNLFLEKNTFTYLYTENLNWHRDHRNESGDTFTVHYHSYKVNFVNSNPQTEVSGNKLFSWHRNYYLGNDPKKWADNVKLYGEVYYKELYSGIDMQVYNVEQNLKYDFIIHPGGNPKDIRMNYKGPNEMHLEYGHLYIKTTICNLIEQKPYAYQVINGIKTEVPCSYNLKNNEVSFSINGKYDKSLPLIIDPTLIAVTYTGSTVDNWGFTSTYDNAGNIYLGGIASGSGYPTTAGAFQTTFGGGLVNPPNSLWPFDVSLTKFNSTGSAILFSTYYGGTGNEQPHSMMVNNANELYVVGRTNSANFPTTGGAYQTTLKGGYDIFVGRINTATGTLLGSTLIGGTGDDCVNISIDWTIYSSLKYNYTDDGRSEIMLDNNSNVYVAACTQSTNFPTMPAGNAFQNVLKGTQDAVVFKLNNTLSTLMFSTYLGGTLNDAAFGIKLDNSNNIYVTGGTNSTNFPTTAGVLHTTFQGGTSDAFISVFNPSASGPAQLLRSTYLGTNAFDQAYTIEIDASGDLYVFGQTKGAYPVTPGVYSNPNSGQFIHKVSGLLTSTIFSTVIGKGGNIPNISPTAFLVDSCQSIYIAGWGRTCALDANQPDCNNNATVGLPITPNAIQSTTDGGDFYFAVLTPNAQSLWYATYYGENSGLGNGIDHVDGGTSRFDKRAFIYEACCASCGGTGGFPTTPTAYSPVNNGEVPPSVCAFYSVAWPCGKNCNEVAVKMDIHVQPFAVVAATSPTSGCAPLSVSFSNTGSSGANFIYDFGDGSPIDTNASPTHTYSTVGTYTLTLYAIDSLGICGYNDTAVVVINVGGAPVLATSPTNILCNGGVGSATVTVTPNSGMNPLTYNWNTSPAQTTTVATGLSAGTYTVHVADALGCSSNATVAVTQPPALTLSTSTTGASCGIANGTATATAGGGTPGYIYSWSPSGGTSSTATGLLANNYTITITDANGCTMASPATISTANGPTATATVVTNVACNGNSTGSASATQTGGSAPFTYSWNTNPVQTTQIATGLAAGTYTVIVTDVNGCSAPATIIISQPTALASSVTPTNVLCNGGSNGSATAFASGGTPGYTYVWGTTPVQTGTTATGLGVGSYSVLITDSKGCSSTQSTTVSQPVPITLNSASSGSNCGGSSTGGTATVTITAGGNAPYTYSWNTSPPQTTSSVSNLTAGTYSVLVTDANGCTAQSAVTITVAVQPNALFTVAQNISCEGISVQISNSSSLATGYSWNFGDGNTSTDQNPIHTFPSSGTFVITLVAENPPCKDTVATTVMIGDLNPLSIGAANVFTPNGDGKNDCFTLAPDTAFTIRQCLYLEIFDRWGKKMFESVGSDNCWDGKNHNDSKPAVDGTYYYIAKLGGTTIKGYVTLIR